MHSNNEQSKAPSAELARRELDDDRRAALHVAWIAWMGGRPSTTVRARCADLRALGAFLGASDWPPEEIAAQLAGEIPSRVRAFVAAWTTAQAARGIVGTTIRRRIATVSSWFHELEVAELASAPLLQRPDVEPYQVGECPAHARVQLVIAELDRAGRVHELATLLVVADVGLRNEELCSLDVPALMHGPPPRISVLRKRGVRVTRTLSERAYRALVRSLDGRAAGPLLCSPRARRWSADSLRNMVRALVGYSPHRLRNTGASELYRTTGNAKLVQEWLGHKNLSSTQHYVRGLSDDAGEATRVLAGE